MKKTKGKNWLEKFQDFWWDDLTPIQRKCLWPVLTALRGPDHTTGAGASAAYYVKLCTTARIRYLLLGKKPRMRFEYKCWPVYGYLTKENPHRITKTTLKKVSMHFKNHAVQAIVRLKPVIKKGEMEDLLKINELMRMGKE